MSSGRWRACIHYRTEAGVVDVEHLIEELEELQDIVERGPDWNTIVKIEVTLHRISEPMLTVEQAEMQ